MRKSIFFVILLLLLLLLFCRFILFALVRRTKPAALLSFDHNLLGRTHYDVIHTHCNQPRLAAGLRVCI